jgi:hypothetical protein
MAAILDPTLFLTPIREDAPLHDRVSEAEAQRIAAFLLRQGKIQKNRPSK